MSVADEEMRRLLRVRPLVHAPRQLEVDYGEEAAGAMLRAFGERCSELTPLLAWPEIATRWEAFLKWAGESEFENDPEVAFQAFAQHLGRLTAYRALALTHEEYARLRELDSILSTGRLKADATTVAAYLREQGVRRILEMRLQRLGALRYDPSLSIHDHPETAVNIAAGYLAPGRPVYRFELDLPVIEVLGWRMYDVNGWVGWFQHREIWHDPTNPRTERFVLGEIAGLSVRCRSVRVFHTAEEVEAYVAPFAEEQRRARELARTARDSIRR